MLLQLHDPWVCTIITMWVCLSVRHQLVKILINLEPYGIFGSNFAYLFILILSSHWYAKRWLDIAERHFFAMPSHRFAYLFWWSLVIVLHTCVLIMLKCFGTHFCTEHISEQLEMLKHSVWLSEYRLSRVYGVQIAIYVSNHWYDL